MSVLDKLKASNRQDVLMPSGFTYTIRLPRLQDLIASGDVPMPILSKLGEADPADATPEELQAMIRFNDSVVCASVVAVDGEAVTLTMDDVRDIPPDDATKVVAIALRTEALDPTEG